MAIKKIEIVNMLNEQIGIPKVECTRRLYYLQKMGPYGGWR